MGKGRKPKPRDLRILEGNPRRHPLPPEDVSKKSVGEPPPSLGQIEKNTWNTLANECFWLKEGDRALLELYCRSYLILIASHSRLSVLLTVDSPSDEQRATGEIAQRAYATSRVDCLRMLAEMGATPATRSKVTTVGETTSEPSDRFFKTDRTSTK